MPDLLPSFDRFVSGLERRVEAGVRPGPAWLTSDEKTDTPRDVAVAHRSCSWPLRVIAW
jgi:hypothetical protein